MHWLVTFRVGGEVRHLLMKARNVPNIKAVAFSIYTLEHPGKPCPSIARDNVESWLDACGITLLDVQLYQPEIPRKPRHV